jgi:hypothetical protein
MSPKEKVVQAGLWRSAVRSLAACAAEETKTAGLQLPFAVRAVPVEPVKRNCALSCS